jgi:hypothetical protein
VKLKDGATVVKETTPYDADGNYRFDGIADGTYTIEVSLAGYDTKTISGFTVSSGNVTVEDLTLDAAPVVTGLSIWVEAPGRPSSYSNKRYNEIFLGVRGVEMKLTAIVEGYNNPPPQEVEWIIWESDLDKVSREECEKHLVEINDTTIALINPTGGETAKLLVKPWPHQFSRIFLTDGLADQCVVVWAIPTGLPTGVDEPKGKVLISVGDAINEGI